jgi:NAD(P)H-dependent FMN reductase
MSALSILVPYDSVRRARQGIKAARFIVKSCQSRGHEVELVDPVEKGLPLLDPMYKEYPKGEAPVALEQFSGRINTTDPSVIVSGEYFHGIPQALSKLLDHSLEEYSWRPSGIVCSSAGPFVGARAAMQLRAIPRVQDSFDEDGAPLDDAYPRRAAKFLDELARYARALKAARQAGVPY